MITYADGPERVTPSDLDSFFVGWPSTPTRERRLDLLLVDVVCDAALEPFYAGERALLQLQHVSGRLPRQDYLRAV